MEERPYEPISLCSTFHEQIRLSYKYIANSEQPVDQNVHITHWAKPSVKSAQRLLHLRRKLTANLRVISLPLHPERSSWETAWTLYARSPALKRQDCAGQSLGRM